MLFIISIYIIVIYLIWTRLNNTLFPSRIVYVTYYVTYYVTSRYLYCMSWTCSGLVVHVISLLTHRNKKRIDNNYTRIWGIGGVVGLWWWGWSMHDSHKTNICGCKNNYNNISESLICFGIYLLKFIYKNIDWIYFFTDNTCQYVIKPTNM